MTSAKLDLDAITQAHGYNVPKGKPASATWQLTPVGLRIDGRISISKGAPARTVTRIWEAYKAEIIAAAVRYDVPVELIIATIATESSGKAKALRKEPGYRSDKSTPHRVSAGLMQTLISTAAETLGHTVSRVWLFEPANSIMAGTAYIAKQSSKTLLDPPKVCCAYNAGAVYHQNGTRNRWKMRQFPIGTGKHADRFCAYFNDCFHMFDKRGDAPPVSFVAMLGGQVSPGDEPVAPIQSKPADAQGFAAILESIAKFFRR